MVSILVNAYECYKIGGYSCVEDNFGTNFANQFSSLTDEQINFTKLVSENKHILESWLNTKYPDMKYDRIF